jgi:opacity protein-like surface antigen
MSDHNARVRGGTRHSALALAGLAALGIAGRAAAAEPASDFEYPDHEFSVVTYLWGSEVQGTLGSDSTSTDVDASFSDIVEQLNLGVMVAAGARWGRFVTLFDGMWMELEGEAERGTVQAGQITLGPGEVDAQLHQGTADLKLGYRILEPTAERPISVDLLAGARYWHVRNEIDIDLSLLPDRSFDDSTDWVDGVVGARLAFGLARGWQLVVMGDVGGWDIGSASHTTWQLMGLLGFDLSEKWGVRVGYRALSVERDLADLEFRGPIIGALYRF